MKKVFIPLRRLAGLIIIMLIWTFLFPTAGLYLLIFKGNDRAHNFMYGVSAPFDEWMD